MHNLNNNDLEKIAGGCGIGAGLPSFLEGYIAPPPDAFVGIPYEQIKKTMGAPQQGEASDSAKRIAYWWRARNVKSEEYLNHKEEVDKFIDFP